MLIIIIIIITIIMLLSLLVYNWYVNTNQALGIRFSSVWHPLHHFIQQSCINKIQRIDAFAFVKLNAASKEVGFGRGANIC